MSRAAVLLPLLLLGCAASHEVVRPLAAPSIPAIVRAAPPPPAAAPLEDGDDYIEESMSPDQVRQHLVSSGQRPIIKLNGALKECKLPAGRLVIAVQQGRSRAIYCDDVSYTFPAVCDAIFTWGQAGSGLGSNTYTAEFPVAGERYRLVAVPAAPPVVHIQRSCPTDKRS